MATIRRFGNTVEKEIRVPHPLSIHPCRRTNVETPGSRKQACGRESGSQLAGGQSAVAVGNRASKLAGRSSRKQACGNLEFVHFGTLQQKSHPSPLWGRGWTATRAFTSGGGTGEGVKTPTCLTPCFRYRPSHGYHFFHKQLWRFENHADGDRGPYQSAPPCGRGSAFSGKDVENSRFRPPHPSRPG